MKKILFVFTTMLFFALALSSCKKDEVNNNGNTENPGGNSGGGTTVEYVDLGLPSGTKWKSANETGGYNGYYTFDEAVSAFGDKLPTKEQLVELKTNCTWEWQTDGGCKVTGKNGNSIVLPAAGYHHYDGSMRDVNVIGYYWSSTPRDSEYAWYLFFDSSVETVYYVIRNCGQSVRLVQN